VSLYPDANLIIHLCVHSQNTEIFARAGRVLRWLNRREIPVAVSPWAVYEAKKHLWGLPEDIRVPAEAELEGLLSDWDSVITGWAEAIEHALTIAQELRQRLMVDSADTLHVGWAQAEECTHFASFDTFSGTRALAYARGLKVVPEMKPRDFEQLARLKS